jgi:hypothetical protein
MFKLYGKRLFNWPHLQDEDTLIHFNVHNFPGFNLGIFFTIWPDMHEIQLSICGLTFSIEWWHLYWTKKREQSNV